MAIEHRNQLKATFKTGAVPTEADFGDLIDSALNLDDDGLTVDTNKRIVVGPGTAAARLSVQGDFDVPLSGTIAVAAATAPGNVAATGVGTHFTNTKGLAAGAKLRVGTVELTVVSIASDTQMTVTRAAGANVPASPGFLRGDVFALKDADGTTQFRVDGAGIVHIGSGTPGEKIEVTGSLVANHLQGNGSFIQDLNADAITSGSIAAARLPASVTTAAIDAGRIPNLDASKITTGTLDVSRVSGILPVAKGGTGLSAAGAAANVLRSNGTAWESTGLKAQDIPDLQAKYIQNTTAGQLASNFYISGTGKAHILEAYQQFNINGDRVLSVGAAGESVFVGKGTGASDKNAHANAFVGAHAGTNNTTGDNNVFVGSQAGIGNTTGGSNSVLGADAGVGNTTGSFNTFVGVAAGRANSTGHGNTFLGVSAGDLNTTGSDNVIVGRSANTGSGNLTNAVAIGALAQVTQSNCLVLGSIAGVNAAPNGTKVGIGTTAPGSLLSLKTSAPTDPALEINQGALKVTGAGINTGTFVMIHEVTTASLLTGGGLFTVIDNPHSNGDPKAILIVTPLFNPTGPYPIPAYVVWDGSIGKWMIFVFDIGTPLTPGVRYNVLIVKP